MVELRQLKYFVKVAELEHFGRAAKELHVVQPALSRQVSQLESELELELFERLPRGIRITPAGRVLLERAKEVLQQVEQMLAVTKLVGQGKSGLLKVGFADGVTYSGHMPQIIHDFRKLSPQVELKLISASSVQQSVLLAQENIDIAFVYWLPQNRSDIKHHKINEERVVLAVAKSNKLATRKSIKLADLQDLPFIWFKRSEAPMYYDLMLSQCNRAGLTLNVVQEASAESTMLSLVAADIGMTFITESARRRKPDNVVLLDIQDLKANITLTAMWRAHDKNPILNEFLSVVRQPQKR